MNRILKLILCGAGAVLGFVALAGCGTTASHHARMANSDRIALGDLGPAFNPAVDHSGRICLGAGDSLGQAMFTNYVTIVRAASPELDAIYASEETNNGDR